jgi:hypothetical protein
MKQQLDAFLLSENKKHCLTSTQVEMFSVSEEPKSDGQKGKCYLIENTEEGILKVSNASGKIVFLLAIDDCIFSSSDEKRCDCAIFDDKAFYFIEIKDSGSKKQLSGHRDKAISQLRSALTFFTQQFDFKRYQLNALICFRFQKRYPAQITTRQNDKVDFHDNFNSNLYEGNEIEF